MDERLSAGRRRGARRRVAACIASVIALLALALAASAQATPGTRPVALPSTALNSKLKLAASPRDGDPLLPFATESGDISLSVDGIGTNNPEGAVVKVEKEFADETVRKAYLVAASTGFSEFNPESGEVSLDGTPITWNSANTIENDIDSINVEADVTSLVASQLNAAPAGDSEFTIAEGNTTEEMDGEILAVIFNNPNLKAPNSVTLLYGAQNPFGDSFHVGLAEPVELSKPGFALNLSLGISYGYETDLETSQFSDVKVNGKVMTQMAGGQDDCFEKYSATPNYPEGCPNGTLITVGGIGDSTNDPNPNETLEECAAQQGEPVARCDDELYSLLPFVENGDTELTFETDNPSDNDNIFFGALETHANAAVVGEGITLSPTNGTNKVGQTHTLTATVQNEKGEKLSGKNVTFEVVSGPNAGTSGEGTTNAEGKTEFSYSSSKAGTDHIVAKFTNAEGEVESSNEVSETWEEEVIVKQACTTAAPALDGIASAQHYNEATAELTTTQPGDLIVAYVAADSPFTQGQTSTVTGGGLTWTLVGRENGALGDAEVWEAHAEGPLSSAPITATVSTLEPGSPPGDGYDETITVAGYRNAPGIGGVAMFSSPSGAPTGEIKTSGRCSWVWAIGDDWLGSIKRTAPLLQKVWSEAYDTVGDTYWVQSRRYPTRLAGRMVKINDRKPTGDPYNLVLVDIL
jgi:hypothetical protein